MDIDMFLMTIWLGVVGGLDPREDNYLHLRKKFYHHGLTLYLLQFGAAPTKPWLTFSTEDK